MFFDFCRVVLPTNVVIHCIIIEADVNVCSFRFGFAIPQILHEAYPLRHDVLKTLRPSMSQTYKI